MVPNPQSSWGLIILNRNHFAAQEEVVLIPEVVAVLLLLLGLR